MKSKTTKNYRKQLFISLIIGLCVFIAVVLTCFYSLKIRACFKVLIDRRKGNFVEFPLDYKDMEVLFFTISIGLTAAFFTVLSIFLSSRPKLSLGNFFRYTANIFEQLLLLLYFFNILFIIFIPCLPITKTVAFYYVLYSIVEFIALIVVAFERMLCLENTKKGARLLVSTCGIKQKDNAYRISSDTENFYNTFISAAFSDNTFEVFHELYNLESEDKLEKDFDFKILNYLLSFSQLKNDSDVLFNGLKTIRFYIADFFYKKHQHNKEDIESLEHYVDLFFNFYRRLFAVNSITYPYILECSIWFRDYYAQMHLVDKNDKKNTAEIARIFKKVLLLSKEMVVFSLHYCTEVDIHSHIKDFMNSVQLIEISNLSESREILLVYQKNFIDIVTHIINMIQMQRLNENMLIYVYRALNNIDEIRIFDDNTEIYYEILPRTDFHTVVYSRNYYIVLLLILCKLKNDVLYMKTFKKLRYRINNSEDFNAIYALIGSQLELITEDDLLLLSKDNKFLETYKRFKKEIKNELENRKNKELQNLFNTNYDEKLREASNIIISKLKSDLSSIYKQKVVTDDSLFLSVVYDLNAKILQNSSYRDEKELYDFLTSYIYESLYSHYVNNVVNSIQIKSISEIKGLENESRIFIPRNCFDLLYNDNAIQFNGTSLILYKKDEEKKVEVLFMSSDKKAVVTGSDFEKKFEIIDFRALIRQAQKRIEENDVLISVLFRIYIDIMNDSTCQVYQFS